MSCLCTCCGSVLARGVRAPLQAEAGTRALKLLTYLVALLEANRKVPPILSSYVLSLPIAVRLSEANPSDERSLRQLYPLRQDMSVLNVVQQVPVATRM